MLFTKITVKLTDFRSVMIEIDKISHHTTEYNLSYIKIKGVYEMDFYYFRYLEKIYFGTIDKLNRPFGSLYWTTASAMAGHKKDMDQILKIQEDLEKEKSLKSIHRSVNFRDNNMEQISKILTGNEENTDNFIKLDLYYTSIKRQEFTQRLLHRIKFALSLGGIGGVMRFNCLQDKLLSLIDRKEELPMKTKYDLQEEIVRFMTIVSSMDQIYSKEIAENFKSFFEFHLYNLLNYPEMKNKLFIEKRKRIEFKNLGMGFQDIYIVNKEGQLLPSVTSRINWEDPSFKEKVKDSVTIDSFPDCKNPYLENLKSSKSEKKYQFKIIDLN